MRKGICTMRLRVKVGSSLLALAMAAPMVPATVIDASAQSLVDRLFKNPAKRRRALRDERIRRQQANRARVREIRRQRRAQRATAARQRRVYVEQPRQVQRPQRVQRSTQRVARTPIEKIESPTFYAYKPEEFVTVDMTGAAGVVTAALAAERQLLIKRPTIRQLPGNAPSDRDAVRYEASTRDVRALAPVSAPLAYADETYGDIEIDALVVSSTQAPADIVSPDDVGSLINDMVEEGIVYASNLDEAPVFEIAIDPRVDQLAAAEAAWRLMGSQTERATKPVADAVAAHYEASRRLIWTNGERVKPTARRAIGVLREAGRVGLDPRDYTVRSIPGPGATTAEHMQFELSLTVAVAEYMRDAAIGRVVADRISGYHDLPRRDPELAERLLDVSQSATPDAVMLDANPKSREFGILRDELAELMQGEQVDIPQLPPRVYLRAGSTSEHVPGLMKLLEYRASEDVLDKHADALAAYDGGETLPPALDGFVRDVQAQFDLYADGVIGPKSIARLAVQSNQSRIERLVLAMERARWLPSELGGEYVFINQPAYRVQHVIGDRVNLSMRTVVGKPSNQTNFFYDEIEHIEFNPDWGVPRSIIVNEMLPKLQSDPSYLDRIGYTVRDGRGRKVASRDVNWWKYGSDVPFTVTQPPGPKNALGELKIEFPNKHLIYMHDTNAKKLFSRTERAFSHGCVRLADPRAMAAAVLGTNLADVKRRLAKGHHNAPIDRKIPVYISYFTAWPKDNGEVGYYADMYGRDAALKTALDKTRRARAI